MNNFIGNPIELNEYCGASMDERCVVAGALVNNRYDQGLAKLNSSMLRPAELSPEQEAKIKEECEKRLKEEKALSVKRAVLELAERLVLKGKKPEEAFTLATDFITRANVVVNTFELPEQEVTQ